ncbi:MAG: ATP-dependent sacrificial sulfur transferase LarE [Phycisphaerae bacterium]
MSHTSNQLEQASPLAPELAAKYARMQAIFRELDMVGVAFSAGADSTLILKVALDTLGAERAIAVTAQSPSLAQAELEDAERLVKELGARHVVIKTTEFEQEDYLSNPVNRCYFCKNTLYSMMGPALAERGIRNLVNGTNVDDLGDYRPGLTAASEYEVRSPAAESGMTKADVRALSLWLGLPTHDKPAAPCLSSRVPYGERITPEKLRMIEQGEALLRSLNFVPCRVRCHEKLARIEVNAEEIPRLTSPEVAAAIEAEFREIGFAYVCTDLRGFRSGSLNEVIAFGKPQVAPKRPG